jgi:hypothetical protein
MDYLAGSGAVVVLGRLVTSHLRQTWNRRKTAFHFYNAGMCAPEISDVDDGQNKQVESDEFRSNIFHHRRLVAETKHEVLESRQQISEVVASVF